jgi:glyoxylase-like metal-dependent hydrolase (beta-lactamase superfamily II)
MVHTIDLNFLNAGEAIAAYVIPTENGAVLVECGPHSTIDNLTEGLAKLGLKPEDIHTLLLTHIHFDHAGAAWWFAERGTKVYVHPRGYKHLLNPERLYESARMIYQDKMDELWGEMHPISANFLVQVEDGEIVHADGLEFKAIYTPGHAVHHIAWQLDDVIFSGDVGGVKIGDGLVVPPCPPPDIHVADWLDSIEAMKKCAAKRLYLTHYGPVDDVDDHLDRLSGRLKSYVEWMRPHAAAGTPAEEIVPLFVDFVESGFRAAGMSEELIVSYRAANPAWMSVAGLLRYLKKYE